MRNDEQRVHLLTTLYHNDILQIKKQLYLRVSTVCYL